MVDLQTLEHLLPEILLIFTAAGIYVAGAFLPPSRSFWTTVATIAYVVAGAVIVTRDVSNLETMEYAASGPLVLDAMGVLLRLLAVVAGVVLTLMVAGTVNRKLPSEYLGSVMVTIAGVMLASQTNDLILLFLALEMVSIPTYILLFIGREGRAGAEATAKYFYLSILASAFMLYGFSFLYGVGGTTSLTGIGAALAAGDSPLLPLAVVLTFGGLGFKIAAVPFHFYAPDVYQGASNPVTAVLAAAPKAAGMAALMRIALLLPPGDFHWKLCIVLAILTMTIGNVGALWQKNFRRLLAYSSIAHAGYMLIGLAVLLAGSAAKQSLGGDSAIVFYLVTYVLASSGALAVATWLGSEQHHVSGVDEFAGLGKTRPATAAAMAVMMFSLAGIPPLAGFWGKLTLFTSAVSVSLTAESADMRAWFVALAVAGALNAAIGAAYYLRVIGVMYFRPASSRSPAAAGGRGAVAAIGLSAAGVVLLGVAPGILLQPVSRTLTATPAAAPVSARDQANRSEHAQIVDRRADRSLEHDHGAPAN